MCSIHGCNKWAVKGNYSKCLDHRDGAAPKHSNAAKAAAAAAAAKAAAAPSSPAAPSVPAAASSAAPASSVGAVGTRSQQEAATAQQAGFRPVEVVVSAPSTPERNNDGQNNAEAPAAPQRQQAQQRAAPASARRRIRPDIVDAPRIPSRPEAPFPEAYSESREARPSTTIHGKTSHPPKDSVSAPRHESHASKKYPAELGKWHLDELDMYLPSFRSVGSAETRSEHLLYDKRSPYVAMSCTVGWKTRDIPEVMLTVMFYFLKSFAVAGIVSLERGKELEHLHIQSTFIVHGESSEHCAKKLQEHMKFYFDHWSCEKNVCQVKPLNHEGDQKFMPMVGVCALVCACDVL